MKKYIIMLVSTLVLSIMLIGCGSQNTSEEKDENTAFLTKAQWIGILGEGFGYEQAIEEKEYFSDVSAENPYYNQIQACKEWDIIKENDIFNPDEKATWAYVIETAVRAIGIENINSSTEEKLLNEENLVDFFKSNIANIGVENLNLVPTKDEALQVLGYSYHYYLELEPENKYEVTYNKDVYEVDASVVQLKGDGYTALISDGTVYNPGDILYVQPTETTGAYAIKVTTCNENVLNYETVGMDAVFEELTISGSYNASVVDANPVNISNAYYDSYYGAFLYDDNSINNLNNCSVYPIINLDSGVSVEQNENNIAFNVNYEDIDFTVELSDINVMADIDYSVFKGLNKANATVNFKDKIEVNYQAVHFAKTIPLGSVTLQLGTTPFQLEVSLVANIGLDGQVTLTYTSNVVGKVQYAKGKGLVKSINNNDVTFDFHAEVTVTAEPSIKVDLLCLGRSIVNINLTTGVVAVATVDVDLMGELPSCVDIHLYVPLRWGVNQDGCIMTAISDKLKYSCDIWNSENSPIQEQYHWEDSVLVEECTRNQEHKVETPAVDEQGEPYDEYKLFEFEEISFGHIDIASTNVYLDKGETITLGIISVPEGYDISDLVYVSNESGICSVTGGRITGVNSGSTMLKISTADEKYSVYVNVVVKAEYNDTSDFQPL